MGRVLVLGNAGLDLTLQVPRLPEKGETLLGDGAGSAPGGKGLNQAVTAARTGAQVIFHAAIGHDAQGAQIAAALASEGISELELHHVPYSSDFSLLMVLPDGENSIVSAGSCAAALTVEMAENFAANTTTGDIVLLQGNLTQASTLAALATATARGATTLFNPAPLWWDVGPLLPLCNIVIANRGEAKTITGLSEPTAAAAALCRLGASIAIITLGAGGCLTSDSDGTIGHYPASKIRAIDTTGCGDTFCGVFAAMLAMGLGQETAINLAQSAAALTAQHRGAFTALPSRDELAALTARIELARSGNGAAGED
ncbi:ribokinase [Phyllobacterium bourgognense]|uniref:Ribokinase n=1 Tax=Phyllobacterium bourgognense TaxID=314236 RepID=A0A368ZAT0_9HYPH|nr:ribokinase [Phyllobacterium bourgognense]RCW87564.1 ribokinase [Phyllobacterium bourgognense]